MNQDRLIRIKEVMELTGLKKSTVWLYTKNGILPKKVKQSKRVTSWKYSEIMAYVDSVSK